MSAAQYSNPAKIFHWLTAILILAIIPLGVIGGRLPSDTDQQIATLTFVFSLHKTLGVMVFFVALARIFYAMQSSKPGPLHPERKIETRLAESVHWLLYASLVLMPLTGWIYHSASAFGAPIWIPFAQKLPFVPIAPSVADLFGGLHWIWGKIMVASILLHIIGGLKHFVIDKDVTLGRMWFNNSTAIGGAHPNKTIPMVTALAVFTISAAIGGASGLFSHTKNTAATLETVQSDWQVTEGDIGIEIMQLGNAVSGRFQNWTSDITFDPAKQGVAGHVKTTIDIGSLSLGTVGKQAMGADYFDLATYPTAVFEARLIAQETDYLAQGTLTIKDSVLPVSMPFELTHVDNVATMNGTLSIDRRDFAIGDSITDQENLGFEVLVSIAVTATR